MLRVIKAHDTVLRGIQQRVARGGDRGGGGGGDGVGALVIALPQGTGQAEAAGRGGIGAALISLAHAALVSLAQRAR